MKKILILASILALTAVNIHAQGYFNPDNSSTGVFVTIQDPSINGGVPVQIGNPATAAGFTGAGRAQVTISLYAAINGTSITTLESAGSLVCTTNNLGASGIDGISGSINLPVKPGFDGSQPVEFILFGVDSTGTYKGWSTETGGLTPTVGSAGRPVLFGTGAGEITSFVLTNSLTVTPEPSTFAIAGVGAAILALFRPRKNKT